MRRMKAKLPVTLFTTAWVKRKTNKYVSPAKYSRSSRLHRETLVARIRVVLGIRVGEIWGQSVGYFWGGWNIYRSMYYMVLYYTFILLSNFTRSSGFRNFGEGGGQETWNISRRARWPSFFWAYFYRGHGPFAPPPPRIRYWHDLFQGFLVTYLFWKSNLTLLLLGDLIQHLDASELRLIYKKPLLCCFACWAR